MKSQKEIIRNREGFERLLRLSFSMNSNGGYRRLSIDDIILSLKPSETTRQTSLEINTPRKLGCAKIAPLRGKVMKI